MTTATPAEILATYDKHARAARKTTPGGVLLRPDLLGVWRRVAALQHLALIPGAKP